MHDEFHTADTREPITGELLELGADFLHRASPIVHIQLSRLMIEKGFNAGGLDWFLDKPGFITLNCATPSISPGAAQR